MPKESNPTFTYTFKTAKASSLEEARKESLGNLLEEAGLSKGLSVVSDYTSARSMHTETRNNQKTTERMREFHVNTSVQGKEVQFYGINVDEYWEQDNNGMVYLTTLYMRSTGENKPNFDDYKLTSSYGVHGLWRSAIVPGWGQLYKGSTLKGGLILGGTVAFIGGIINTETMRQDYMNKIKKTHNTDNIRSYKTRADNFAMGRNICIGGLAALYVYNIVDAIVAPGARRIVTKKNANGSGYSFTPTLTTDGGLGIYAQITF